MGIFRIDEGDLSRAAMAGLRDYEKSLGRNIRQIGIIYQEVLENIASVDATDPNSQEYLQMMTDTLEKIRQLMDNDAEELRRLHRMYSYY